MRKPLAVISQWASCLCLAVAVVPTRPVAFCVADGKVVRVCPMTATCTPASCCPEPEAKAHSCCPSQAESLCHSDIAASGRSTHCELLAGPPALVVASTSSKPLVPTVWLDVPPVPPPVFVVPAIGIKVFIRTACDSDPPPKTQFVPDRGRAPPVEL